MTDDSGPYAPSLPLAALERIDGACCQFESAWKEGQTPRIEDHLSGVQGSERSELLRQLLYLELDYLRRRDGQPVPGPYQARFPQDHRLVSDVFEQMSTEDTALSGTTPSSPAEVARKLALPSRFGDYQLLEVLGEGGMGVVYRARQETPDRVVALKIIRPDRLAGVAPQQREIAIERFRAETQAAASLEHENIVPVYEVGQFQGLPFFSMRFIRGHGLGEVLREGPLDGRDAAVLLEPVARALHYAHGREIIHRDIKPRNILLDTELRPYIADFGLAKSFATSQDLTQTADAVGTPAYMSPEQTRGPAGVDLRTDVYSLGATLYELLTGRPPFRAATVAETLRQVIEDEPVSLRRLNPAVPRDLETICLKCLEKDRHRRYSSAAELADELRRFLEFKPIVARPVGSAERLWRWGKRNPIVAGLSGAVALSLVLGLAVSLTLAFVAEGRRRKADGLAQRNARLLRESRQKTAQLELARAKADELAQRNAKLLEEARQKTGELERASANLESELQRSESARYAIQLTVANRNLSDGDVVSAQQVLKECREDLCGWEHRYLSTHCQFQMRTLEGHEGWCNAVAFSPDGNLLASGGGRIGEPGELILWNVITGQKLRQLKGHAGCIRSLVFNSHGTLLASASDDGTAKVWDLAAGEVLQTLEGHEKGVNDICFSHDEQTLATAGGDATIRVWNPETGEQLGIMQGDQYAFFEIDFSRHGDLVSASADRLVTFWDWSEGRELQRVFGHTSHVRCVAFSPDGQLVASGGAVDLSAGGNNLGELFVWEAGSRRRRLKLEGHTGDVYAVAFSPDGSRLASASGDHTVRIWDVTTGQQLFTLRGHTQTVGAVTFSPDNQFVASGGGDKTVRIWRLDSPEPLTRRGLCRVAKGVTFSPNGKRLAAVSTETLSKPATLVTGGDEAPRSSLAVWDAENGRTLLRLHPHTDSVEAVAFSPDGQVLATAGDNATIQMWDSSTGEGILSLQHAGLVGCIAFSADGSLFASGSSDQTVQVWRLDAADAEELCRLRLDERVSDICFSPSDHRLAAASGETITVFDAPTGKELVSFGSAGNRFGCVTFLAEGVFLAANAGKQLFVWNATNGEERFSVTDQSAAHICSLASSHRNTPPRLVTGSADGTVKVWDATTGHLLLILEAHRDHINGVVFSPDGTRLASAGWDNAIKIWSASVDPANWIDTMPHNAAAAYELGSMLESFGKDLEAATAYKQAVEQLEVLVIHFPKQNSYRKSAGDAANKLGIILKQKEQLAEAERHFRRGLIHRETLLANDPHSSRCKSSVGGILSNLAGVRRDQQQHAEACDLLERAITLQNAAIEAEPNNALYRRFLRNHHWAYAETLVRMKKHQQAAEMARKLPQITPDSWQECYWAAAFLSRCIPLAELDSTLDEMQRAEVSGQYAEQAVVMLQEARNKGLTDLQDVETSPQFAPLRSRECFRQLTGDPGQ